MSKIKKKFIALIVVFTSIISLLPLGFNSEVAKRMIYLQKLQLAE